MLTDWHVDVELTPEEMQILIWATDHYQLVLKHAKSNVPASRLHSAMDKITACMEAQARSQRDRMEDRTATLPRRRKRRKV